MLVVYPLHARLWSKHCLASTNVKVSRTYVHVDVIYYALLTVDFSSIGLLIDFRITLLFCIQVQHRLAMGLPTTMYGNKANQ